MTLRDPWHCGIFVGDVETSTLGHSLSRWDDAEFAEGPMAHTDHGARGFGLWRKTVRIQPADPFFKVTVEAIDPPSALCLKPSPRWHHIGYRSQAFRAEVAALEEIGFRREAWGQDDDGQLSLFAYMVSPEGLRIELNPERAGAEVALREKAAAAVAKDIDAGIEPEKARGRPVSHISAVVSDPVRVAAGLTAALDLEWNAPLERTFVDARSATAVRCVEISTRGARRVRLLSELPAPLGAESGWNHLAFWTEDLAHDTAVLAGRDYAPMASSEAGPDGVASTIFRAPEGTLVMLAQGA
jgi:hypothetical protein